MFSNTGNSRFFDRTRVVSVVTAVNDKTQYKYTAYVCVCVCNGVLLSTLYGSLAVTDEGGVVMPVDLNMSVVGQER